MNSENNLIIEFQKNDLLNFEEILTLIKTMFASDKFNILVKRLRKYLIINKGSLYIFNSENTIYNLVVDDDKDDYIKSVSRTLIEESFKNLQAEERTTIYKDHSKQVPFLLKITYINDILKDIKMRITRNNIDFSDPQINEIHFINGYFDLKDFTFKPRDINKHFMTYCIDRKYIPPKNESIKTVMNIAKQIYPNENDRNCVLSEIGAGITGKSSIDQTNLFLLGLGSSGKSTLMKLTKASISIYLKELKDDTFTIGNPKIDKILNSFMEDIWIRISWINEMEDKKMNDTLFKSFCEGNLQTTALYKDKCHNFKHYTKLILTANTFPNIKIDSGTDRRIIGYTHKSNFTEDLSKVDDKKNIYLGNKKLIDNMENNPELLNAWFYIIAKYANDWNNEIKYPLTPNFIETKASVVGSNDITQDFIDQALIETTSDSDRIGKDEMHQLFLSIYPKSHITLQQLIGSLKQKNILYKGDCRHNLIKGCYLRVKVKQIGDPMKDSYNFKGKNEQLVQNDMVLKTEYDEALNQIEALNKQIEELKTQLQENKKPKKEKKNKSKKQEIIIEQTDEELEEELSGLSNNILDLI